MLVRLSLTLTPIIITLFSLSHILFSVFVFFTANTSTFASQRNMKTTLSLLLALGTAAQGASIAQRDTLLPPSVQAARAANTTRPTFFNSTSCTAETMRVRKEWRNMSPAEKTAFLTAETCLMALPAQTTLDGVTSRWSDLQSLHRALQNTTIDGVYVEDVIHNVGQFLPWHRLFMHAHEHGKSSLLGVSGHVRLCD